ncbi:MlaC/ttg2D family ABC transporter substrate-binding protein [Desulforhabdus amnigena]|uniref:Organic solvent tolerance ABC transporter substrate-binding protein n=1 Tax=Desulforhabdus amnigena TaxID=40218 RepID=A0A9W6FWP8_9BACT|nr:ABC transporter substrate-binding protein [Desulforhabdus amnigena]NLJ27132.1 ABC transporter substrate-binding protein [Deltaproteobacteria bacterium]GLI36395.1 organic solvent tolerance ABC transporter substrate-binding protein [Desulforhabdus amnigena]
MTIRMTFRYAIKAMPLAFFLLSAVALVSADSGPLQVIQSGTDRALDILHSSQAGKAPTIRQRRAEILTIVDEYFDFYEMGKRALGRPWKDQPAQKQKEFVDLFKQLLFNTYVDRVETYTGSEEKVVYDNEEIKGTYAFVKTRVLNYKNTDVAVDYRLQLKDGKWKVYDVIVEGVSLVSNYRSQFNSILANEDFDALLKKLREKVAEWK